MKKFITAISLQFGRELQKLVYEDMSGGRLTNDKPTAFPIITAIKNNVGHGDEISVVPIIYEASNAESNYPKFIDELNTLKDEVGFNYTIAEPIYSPFSEDKALHGELFKKLISRIDDEDDLYACITYGNKPLPIVIFSALNYASIIKNAYVDTICYGQLPDHKAETPTGKIFDVTSLFYINSLTEKAVSQDDPATFINTLLNLKEESEGQ